MLLGQASSADQYTLDPPGHVLMYVHVKCAAVRLANCQQMIIFSPRVKHVAPGAYLLK